MALTRRTPRFAELAEGVEERLTEAGVVIDSEGIDEDLRCRIDLVAKQMDVSDRRALDYAPDDLPVTIAAEILTVAIRVADELDAEASSLARPRHLRAVDSPDPPTPK